MGGQFTLVGKVFWALPSISTLLAVACANVSTFWQNYSNSFRSVFQTYEAE